jgi:hypothetical protein
MAAAVAGKPEERQDMTTPDDYAATWAEGETPAASNASDALRGQREAAERVQASEFAQAFEQELNKEGAAE